jgi:hypothetical protein
MSVISKTLGDNEDPDSPAAEHGTSPPAEASPGSSGPRLVSDSDVAAVPPGCLSTRHRQDQ